MSLVLDFLVPEADIDEVPSPNPIHPQMEKLQSALELSAAPVLRIAPPETVEHKLTPEPWTEFFQVF